MVDVVWRLDLCDENGEGNFRGSSETASQKASSLKKACINASSCGDAMRLLVLVRAQPVAGNTSCTEQGDPVRSISDFGLQKNMAVVASCKESETEIERVATDGQ